MTRKYNSLIEGLATTVLGGYAFNQYAHHQHVQFGAANAIRRQNLQKYLEEISIYQPNVLLVGEAAGYRGCRLTGVPFTSEKLLLEGISPKKATTVNGKTTDERLFGQWCGYRKTDERTKIIREATATIIWSVLVYYWPPPLLWNAFPFHPHKAGDVDSNRPPTQGELELGHNSLIEITRLFNIRRVVAVGKKASQALDKAGIPAQVIRHPSYGGKRQFTAGIHAFLSDA